MVTIIVILLVFILCGYFFKNEYTVVREITITKPKQIVFDYIKLLRNQNEYSYYNLKDPQTIKSYSGTDGEVGFKYTFSSTINSIGSGTQTISKIIEGEMMCCDIAFSKPLPLQSFAVMSVTAINENETKVSWSFKSHYKFPLNVIIYFVNLEKLIGTDIASSLVILKENVERIKND